MVKLNDGRSFVMADLPGLIEGAADGVGLGLKFLRHAERTKVLAHVVDMGSSEGRDPIRDYEIINTEINKYSKKMAGKPMIVLANKMDLPDAEANLEKFKKVYPDVEVIPISAIKQDGIDKAMTRLMDIIETTPKNELYSEEDYASHVVYKYENALPFTVKKVNGMWRVEGTEISKLFKMTKFTEDESVARFSRKLKGMGVEEALLNAGATLNDDIEIEGYVFKFKD